MNTWTESHTHTLINMTALLATKEANEQVDENGEPCPCHTAEYGLQMIQCGFNAYLTNLAPTARHNADSTLCIAQGCHVMHAIQYLTQAEADALGNEWKLEQAELEAV